MEAARMRDDFCSDAAGDDTTIAASTVNKVSSVWEQVSETYELSKQPFLLYWRGVLEQCLDQEERAREDLEAFLDASAGDSTYVDLVRDARYRLRRLSAGQTTAQPVGPVLAAGIATGAGSGVMVGLAGWQQQESDASVDRYYSGELETAEFPFVELNAVEAAQRRNALAVTAGALAAGSIASFVVVATRAEGASDAGGLPVVSVVPTPEGGVVVGLAGRW